MNVPEDDIPEPEQVLTPLERELLEFLKARGIDHPDDLDFIVRRVRTTLRVVQLGQALGRTLNRRERGQAFRKFQDGTSTEEVLRWILAKKKPEVD